MCSSVPGKVPGINGRSPSGNSMGSNVGSCLDIRFAALARPFCPTEYATSNTRSAALSSVFWRRRSGAFCSALN